jgi:glycosyltransferase involved in cell wall biosynthesis
MRRRGQPTTGAGGLRVAMIGQRGIPATFGGIEHHVEELSARLVARGHQVTVFCRTNYAHGRPPTWRGVRLRHLPTVGTKHLDALVHSGLATIAALQERFDVVHYHALGPGALAAVPRCVSRAGVVLTVHGLDDRRAKWGGAASTMLRGAGWLSARVPHATVVVSRELERHYRETHGRAAVYIPNGAPTPERHPPGRMLHRLGVEPGRYLLFVGRFVPEKAPDLLVRAFARVPGEVRLVLAGDSSFTDGYAARVRADAALDQRIALAGYVYGDDLDELYANAAAFVLPSLLEGLPLTLLEAAAHATPVVASAIPPHVEVLAGSGPGRHLVTPGDEGALTAALTRVLADPMAERAGAARLRDRVRRAYSWDAAADATEHLYQAVLAGLSPAHVTSSVSRRREHHLVR